MLLVLLLPHFKINAILEYMKPTFGKFYDEYALFVKIVFSNISYLYIETLFILQSNVV